MYGVNGHEALAQQRALIRCATGFTVFILSSMSALLCLLCLVYPVCLGCLISVQDWIFNIIVYGPYAYICIVVVRAL